MNLLQYPYKKDMEYTSLNFPKELLLSCKDNIELFKLHLPNHKVFLQEIFQKDNVELYIDFFLEVKNLNDFHELDWYNNDFLELYDYFKYDPLPINIIKYHVIKTLICKEHHSKRSVKDTIRGIINFHEKINLDDKKFFKILLKKIYNWSIHKIMDAYKDSLFLSTEGICIYNVIEITKFDKDLYKTTINKFKSYPDNEDLPFDYYPDKLKILLDSNLLKDFPETYNEYLKWLWEITTQLLTIFY